MSQKDRKCSTCDFFVREEHKILTKITCVETQKVTLSTAITANGYCRRNPIPIDIVEAGKDWCGEWRYTKEEEGG